MTGTPTPDPELEDLRTRWNVRERLTDKGLLILVQEARRLSMCDDINRGDECGGCRIVRERLQSALTELSERRAQDVKIRDVLHRLDLLLAGTAHVDKEAK